TRASRLGLTGSSMAYLFSCCSCTAHLTPPFQDRVARVMPSLALDNGERHIKLIRKRARLVHRVNVLLRLARWRIVKGTLDVHLLSDTEGSAPMRLPLRSLTVVVTLTIVA